MPNTKSAKKALRQSEKRKVLNLRRKRVMRVLIKSFKELVGEGKTKEARNLVPSVYKAIDKAMKRNIIKKNTASRKKSRLMAYLNKASVR